MTRPTFEVADILRTHGDRFLDRYRSSFGYQQLKAFRAILPCRTAALGGHRDACPSCGHQAISYNSCRNRHCPKCQAQTRQRWLAARQRELLATRSGGSAACTPGDRTCSSIPTFTAPFLRADYRQITVDGSAHAILSSYP